MASGIQDLSLTFAARAFTVAAHIATQSCLAWLLQPSGRGSYAVCLVFAGLLELVFAFGCDIATIYFVSSKRLTLSEGISYALLYGGVSSGLAIIAGLILMQCPFSFFDKASPSGFYLALGMVPSLLFSLTFQNLFTAIQQFRCYAAVLVLDSLNKLLLTISFVWVLSWGVNGALLATLIAQVMTLTLALWLFRWKHNVALVRPSARKLLDMFLYGIRYHIGKISNRLNVEIGTILIALFATKEEVGLFAVAIQVAANTMIIPDTLTTVLIPKVARSQSGKRELVAQCSRLTAISCGILLAVLAVFAKPIVTVLFSPKFLAAVPLIQVLILGVFVRCTCKVFVPYLLGTDHPGVVSTSVVVGLVVNAAALWLLLPTIGLLGAAMAVVIGYCVSSGLLFFSFMRFGGLNIRQTFQLRRSDWALIGSAMTRISRTFRDHKIPFTQ
jgi:O-antigen/teichoic acid export membrane protein